MSVTAIATAAAAQAAGSTLIQALPNILGALDKSIAPDSLIEVTRTTRNDFLTVVEEDLISNPYMPSIMQSVLSIVSGYFLSAVSLVVDVPGIEVANTLGRLNTNRDPLTSVLGSGAAVLKTVGTESLQYGLPDHSIALECFQEQASARYKHPTVAVEAYRTSDFQDVDDAKIQQIVDQLNNMDIEKGLKANEAQLRVQAMDLKRQLDEAQLQNLKASGASTAAMNTMKTQQMRENMRMQKEQLSAQAIANKMKEELMQLQIEGQKLKNAEMARRDEPRSMSHGRDSMATLKEVTNLSVGKTFNITFARNGNSLDVPVTLALAVTNTDPQSMYNIVTFNAMNTSFKERLIRAKAGELSYVRDLLLCQDMKEEARRQRIKDKSGFLESMMRRGRKNFWSGLLSMQPSLNNASSVLVLSSETADRAALELGGHLDKFAVREKVFKNTAAMIMVVVDQRWNSATIYHRSLNTTTELQLDEFKRASSKGGGDVESILQAYSAGKAPSLL